MHLANCPNLMSPTDSFDEAILNGSRAVILDAGRYAEVEIELAGQRRVLPRNLLLLRRSPKGVANPLEHRFDREVWLLDVLQERLGIEAIAASAVAGKLAGGRCEGHERPARGVDRRQAARRPAPFAIERIIPAGIEDDDAGARGAILRLHATNHRIEGQRAGFDVRLVIGFGVFGYQIVHPVYLDAVAGEEENGDRTAVIGSFLERLQRLLHFLEGCVGQLDHVEAAIGQDRGDVIGVVGGVLELAPMVVVGVPDDEGVQARDGKIRLLV